MKSTNNEMIVIKNLIKKFKDNVANNNINLTINKGERIGLIGANGAGKTTLVEQIIGTSKPTSGTIEYKFKYENTPQENMGMQFQDSSYPDGISVKDVIDFCIEIYGSAVSKEMLDELLIKFHMQEFYKKPAKGLSGGQQQKLNVLLAIIHSPEFVILDEISTGLDIAARTEIVDFVDGFTRKNNTTILLISHNMEEVKQICDRIIVMSMGKIVHDSTIEVLESKYKTIDQFMKSVIKEERDANNK